MSVPRPRSGRDGQSRDPTEAAYFRDVARHRVMTAYEERAAAREIASTETAHWVALLSYAPCARCILASICRQITATSDFKPESRQRALEECAALVRSGARPRARMAGFIDAMREHDPGRDLLMLAVRVARAKGRRDHSSEYAGYRGSVEETYAAQRAAKERFTVANLRLVAAIARNYRYDPGKLSVMELIQEGNLGLMKAVDHFDLRVGCRFSTYASWWIRQSFNRALANQGRAVRVPVHVIDTKKRVARVTQRSLAGHGRPPTPEEVQSATGIHARRVERANAVDIESALSLDVEVGGHGAMNEQAFVDLIEDGGPAPDQVIADADASAAVARLLKRLTPFERSILRARFGIGAQEHTLRQIGDMHELSRERIRQVQNIALQKLRKHVHEEVDGV